MEFTSHIFIFFLLPMILLGITFLHEKYHNFFIVLSSISVYFISGKSEILVLFSIIASLYLSVMILEKSNSPILRKLITFSFILLTVFGLLFFKYNRFLIRFSFLTLNIEEIIMPLGFSYYVFKSISCVLDVYFRRAKSSNLLQTALYISYFPEIFSGPITLYRDFQPQIKDRSLNFDNVGEGIRLFIVGASKKVIIASTLANTINLIKSYPSLSFGTISTWFLVILYSFQLYYDFSGFTDMSIGISSMLGFKVQKNFNHPYISSDYVDFWRRWHISLSTWFKEYVYIPLGGNRNGNTRTNLNTMIVFILTGMWHGSSLNYLLWGVYNGVIVIFTRGIKNLKCCNLTYNKVISRIVTYFLVLVSWAIFMSNGLKSALIMIKNLFIFSPSNMEFLMSLFNIEFILVVFLASFFAFSSKMIAYFEKKIYSSSKISTILFIAILFITVLFLLKGSFAPSIYTKF